MVNMLINGDTKYNRSRRNKKREKLNKWRPIKYKEDKTKVPLIVFGSGMFNKEHQQDQDAQMWGDRYFMARAEKARNGWITYHNHN
ncbi:uncharacterized protein BX663DRAFT_521661 [Cokeromyces recurvatus]|uniref:uncharacterized protein n=1 Tax=Cokeromyces recurvatus TaxID=90255 RepID=UPI00221F5C68|nr:uncharacterized protein BX663DRAFT_521661 [Cokeromyces recurvatus]KAI7899414.1 hypothetical protein BX663DRAFT_521661 [Cokeromyces recurvatus]